MSNDIQVVCMYNSIQSNTTEENRSQKIIAVNNDDKHDKVTVFYRVLPYYTVPAGRSLSWKMRTPSI